MHPEVVSLNLLKKPSNGGPDRFTAIGNSNSFKYCPQLAFLRRSRNARLPAYFVGPRLEGTMLGNCQRVLRPVFERDASQVSGCDPQLIGIVGIVSP
jgi:hypothetical protein